MPHTGFGLGLERMMMNLTDLKNIRAVIPFPPHAGKRGFLAAALHIAANGK